MPIVIRVVERGDHRADAVAELEAEGDVDEDEHQGPEDGLEGVPLDLLATRGTDARLADRETGIRHGRLERRTRASPGRTAW
jgi:hypothetical protein